MALPPQFTNFIENNGSTLQNMALLAYLRRGEEARPFLDGITAAMVCVDVYKRISSDSEIDRARTETILNIAKYVKDHPHARPKEVQNKVEEEVEAFKTRIKNL